MPDSFSRPDLRSPTSVAETTFSSALRGYRPEEVRMVLRDVAAELGRLHAEVAELTARTATAAAGPSGSVRSADLDDDTVRQVLGEEMVKVLQTAREAAAEVLERGEQNAAQLIREASTQAAALRHEAELEVARLRTEAQAQIQAELDRAREQGREMVVEAQAYRDKLMAEAGRRRDAAREQIDRLLKGHERMVEVFERALRVTTEVVGELGPVTTPEPYLDLRVNDSGPVPQVPAAVAPPPFDVGADEDFAVSLAEPEPGPETEAVPHLEEETASNVVDLFPPATEEPSAPMPAASGVDDLFAKLRAETAATDPEPVAEAEPSEAPDLEPDDQSDDQSDAEPDESPFGQREAAVVPLIVASARKIKRVLADEQNEALGRMSGAGAVGSVSDLVADPEAHTQRYVQAMLTELTGAFGAGAAVSGAELGQIPAADLGRITSFVADGLMEPLRSRLDRAVLDAGGDADDTIRRVRAVYREWKTQHIEQHLEDVMRLAYGLGVLAGVPAGTKMCWLIDPQGEPCPDAEDNFLAGEVAAGEAYPTGHTYAPAYPRCRCLVLPAAEIAESS